MCTQQKIFMGDTNPRCLCDECRTLEGVLDDLGLVELTTLQRAKSVRGREMRHGV